MKLAEYHFKAMTTRLPSASAYYTLLNLGGEVGELMSLEAKAVRDGPKETHRDNVLKELGDILWHVAAIADDYGFSLEHVAAMNLQKLASRQERGVLEGSGDNR
jgi:NTP pyrophosphatase (non-canonical NTP hydrolase)